MHATVSGNRGRRWALLAVAAGGFALALALRGGDGRVPTARPRSERVPVRPGEARLVSVEDVTAPPASAPERAPAGASRPARDEKPILVEGTLVRKIYSSRGVNLSSPSGGLTLSLRDVRIGGRPLPAGSFVADAAPRAEGAGEIVFARGAVTEKYVPRGDAVEQIFVLGPSVAPLKRDGDLTIDVSLETDLVPELQRRGPAGTFEDPTDSVELKTAAGAVAFTYGGAVAIDASGRRRALSYLLQGGRLEMKLDAAFLSQADFPLTVDPLVGSNFSIDASVSTKHVKPDVAFNPTSDAWLVVWEDEKTSSNGDILCRAVSPTGSVSTVVALDSTSFDARNPRVARYTSNQFFVVWQQKGSGGNAKYEIYGQYVTVSGLTVTAGTKYIVAPITSDVQLKNKDLIMPDVGYCSSAQKLAVSLTLVYALGDHDVFAFWIQGGTRGPETVIDNLGSSFEEKSTVTPVGANPMGIAYAKRTLQGSAGDLYVVSFDVGTSGTSGRITVSSHLDDDDFPSLGGTDGTPSYVVWQRTPAAGGGNIYGRRVSLPALPADPSLGVEFGVETGPELALRPHCDVANNGADNRLMVTWSQNPSTPATADAWNIHAKIYDRNGDPAPPAGPSLLETHQISATLKDDDNGRLAVDPGRMTALVAFDTALSLSNFDINGQRVAIAPVPGITVSAISGETTEGGGTATFTVRLDKAPAAGTTVRVPYSSSNPGEGTPSPAFHDFTSTDWNIPKTVTVTGVNDFRVDGSIFYFIRTDPVPDLASPPSDPSYVGLNGPDVSVVNKDDDFAGFDITPTSGLITTEGGGTATFQVRLTSEPYDDVEVYFDSSDVAEGQVTTALPLMFTSADWNVYQTVTVTGVNEFVDDGDKNYFIYGWSQSPGDFNYDFNTPPDVFCTNRDDDTANITVNPTGGLQTTEGGGTASFTIVLTSQPSADVTIGLTTSDSTEGIVLASSVLFTPGNWSTAQTVTVQGQDDVEADGNIAYTIATAPASSSDPLYNTRNAPDVGVTNLDNDLPGITVNPTAGLTTTEGGAGTSFTIVLNSQPTAGVTINLSSSNTGEGTITPTFVSFTTSNWNTAQTVNVTGVNDDVDDGNKLYTIVTAPATSTDPNYSGRDASDVSVTNVDDDTAGFTLSQTSGLVTTEIGGTAFFTIRLNSQPTANVTIGISSNDTTEGTVSVTSVTFTPTNWSTAQTVTVAGVNDAVDDGDIGYTVVTAAATGGDYAGMNPPDVACTNQDDDTRGFTFSRTSGLVTTESGGSDSFTLRLNSEPTATVTINLSSSLPGEGTPSPTSLTFTTSDWNTARTVTVTGVDDPTVDGSRAYQIITGAASGGDYAGMDPSDVSCTNNDNDVIGFTLSQTSGLVTTEGGTTASFTIRLNSQPNGDVTIALSVGGTDPDEATVSPASVTFNAATWNSPQTVTATGVNDDVVDGTRSYTIVTGPATGTDTTGYIGQDPPDVSCSNNDNDTIGFVFSQTSGLVTSESGTTASFTVRLNSQPNGDVTIPLSVGGTDPDEATVLPASVTFNATNWNTAQTVTATGANDFVVDGTRSYSIVTGTVSGTDTTGYVGQNPSDVSCGNTDNDTASITVTLITPATTTEAGGFARFTMVLTSQPSANVSVNLSSSDSSEGTPSVSSVTFTPSDWNTAQTVTVTGVDDFSVDGNVPYSIATAAATSTDGNYAGFDPADVNLTNTDNDVAMITVSAPSPGNTTEAGGMATFTVVLTSRPDQNVTVNLASLDTSEGTVSPASLTFTSANWSTAQTVTVTGVDDDFVDGNPSYVIETTAVSADPNYGSLNPADVTLTNTDNDVAGFQVTPTSGLVTSESGGTATFTVRLTSQPSASVTIGVASSLTSEGTVSTASLTFDATNWNTAQTVTVTGVNDAPANPNDGNIAYTINLTADTGTADLNYRDLDPTDVSATNQDNDTPGVTVTPTSGLVTTEAGGTASFTVVLNTSLTDGIVTITLSLAGDTDEVSLSTTTVTFDSTNAQIPKTVTLTGLNDFIVDGTRSYTVVTSNTSHTGGMTTNYDNLPVADVTGDNTDNDSIGFVVTSPTGPTTEGGGQASFTVRLTSQPTGTATVTIPVSSLNTAEGTVSTGLLTFTTSDWNTAQTVTVTGVDDDVADGNVNYTVNLAAASGGDYAGQDPPNVTMTNNDNDAAGFTVTPLSPPLNTTEAGGIARFTVRLTSKPTANVTIGLSSSNTAEGTLSASSLLFTPSDWNTAQTVTVTGVDDVVDDGDKAYTVITAPASSTDLTYNNLDPANVSVTNLDDDTAGVTVNPTTGLSTNESGTTATFTVVLNTQPVADVTISISSSDPTEGSVSSPSLTFTSANWNTAQTVTVTGVDDFVVDGFQDFTVVTGSASSPGDGAYNGKVVDDVSVRNNDNDVAGYTLTPITGPTTEAAGTASFTLRLTSQPTGTVIVGLSIGGADPDEGTVLSASVTFDATNWNTAQTVTVRGADDFVDDGDRSYTVITAPATGTDSSGYVGGASPPDPADVVVTNTDDDTAGFVFSRTSGLVTTESSGQDTFTLKLASQPTGTVRVDLSIGGVDPDEATVSPAFLQFDASDWSVAKVVTVTGADDPSVDGLRAYLIVTAAATGTDTSGYVGLDPSDVSASNSDNDTAGITVSAAPGLSTTEAGGTATFTLVLTSRPAADVTLTVSSSNTAEGTVPSTPITFTASNWNTAQTVTVTGVDDPVDDGNASYTIFTNAAASTDPDYAGLNPADVSVLNLDDDAAGITVNPSLGLSTTEAGGTATFTIVLNSQPTADVSISLSSSNTAEGTVSPSAVTFTSSNWNTAQTVTVAGVDDFVDDGNKDYTVVTGAAVSTDSGYAGLNATDVSVTNTDNDSAGFVILPSTTLTTTEGGGAATFTVRLSSQPSADVSTGLSSSNTNEGTVSPSLLTFTPGNWNVNQTVTVTGANDFVVDGTIAYQIVTAAATSSDPLYSGSNPADVNVNNQDDDVIGITVNPTSGLITTESGGSATFTVVLNTIPANNVTINLNSSNTNEGTVSPTSLTFTPANALTPQMVTVTGANDTVADGPQGYTVVTQPALSADGQYNGVNAPDVSVTNQDNDVAGISVSPTSGLVTTEGGGSATFTVVLTSTPSGGVSVNLSISGVAPFDADEISVSPVLLNFTTANALTPQTVTVTGLNDTVADGPRSWRVDGSAGSADAAYNGRTFNVTGSNQDNDVVGIAVSPTAGLTTTEGGGTASFTVVLTSTPSANVTVDLSIGGADPDEGTLSAVTLTFTPLDALTPQTVTVTGVDDTIDDGDRTFDVVTAAAQSGDPQYAGVNPPDVTVTNQDDDTVGFTVTPTSGLFTNEYGDSAQFTVRLNTTPSADVTINLSSSNTNEGIVSPASVTFTPTNWNTAQTVTVTGVNDTLSDGNVLYDIVTDPAVSFDGNYSGRDAPDVQVLNLDNEGPGITVTPNSGLITSEAGGTDTFTVVLNTVPTSNVTISLSSSNLAEGTVSPVSLTFTPANALTPQTVTVTGANDAITDGDVSYTIVTAAASSSDGAYNGVNADDVSVLNVDDEPVEPPRIGLSAVGMSFTAIEGGSNPAGQSMSITNSGGGTLSWTLTDGVPWLNQSPGSGSLGPGVQSFVTVTADITGLTAGTYTAAMQISDPLASNNPQEVEVTLTVLPPPPTISITSPNTDPFDTLLSAVPISGTASAGTTVVTWANAATGETGVASGAPTSWAASIPLMGGANFITVYAWNAGGAGVASITVNYMTDAVPPTVTVTFPSMNASFNASSTPVTVAGSATDDTALQSVTWYNLTTGTSGTATGTSSWITSIPLANGPNTVMVVAKDVAGNTTTQTVTINYASPPDAGLPAIQILVPTTQPTFAATSTPLDMAGTAGDSVGVTKVTWWNATTGGRGVATGTSNWSASVPLAAGGNFLSVTAYDPSGNTATATLLVSYVVSSGDTVSPYLVITTPTTLPTLTTGTSAVRVAGFAADDVELNTVVWENQGMFQTGTANGLASWNVDLTLAEGVNPVTLTAYDKTGNKTAKTLTIDYRPPIFEPPPIYVAAGHQYCGSVGVDLLIPLALVWLGRRAFRARGSRKGTGR
jgi:hypothetical protein